MITAIKGGKRFGNNSETVDRRIAPNTHCFSSRLHGYVFEKIFYARVWVRLRANATTRFRLVDSAEKKKMSF
jgi:hypothetical protein